MQNLLISLRSTSALALSLLFLAACSGAGDVLPDASDGSEDCVAKTCRDLGLACGTFDDGCGDRIVCEESCGCTDEDFREACPERPCETVFGCHGGQCAYRPITCDDTECLARPCEGEGCEVICSEQGCDDGLYPCSDSQRVCAGVRRYCDPAPKLVGGQLTYQNQCIPAPKMGCGACELGALLCDEDADRFVCEEAPLPAGTSCTEDFVYVDPTYTEGGSDGSKARPFLTYAQAVSTAKAENKAAIIIGGSPTFTEQLVIEDGISLYGGFGNHPEFRPDPSARPSWTVAATASTLDEANGRLVGMVARHIDNPTVIRGIRVETGDARFLRDADGNGASNFAALVDSSRELSLINMELIAGRAGDGAAGSNGSAPTNAMRGGDGGQAGNRFAPGIAPSACPRAADMQACTLSALPDNGVRRIRGVCEAHGATCQTTCNNHNCVEPNYPGRRFLNGTGYAVDYSGWPSGASYSRACGQGGDAHFLCGVSYYSNVFGNRGANDGPLGGKGGEHAREHGDPPAASPGTDGDPGFTGSDGTSGMHASAATLDTSGRWRAAHAAIAGEPGYRGTWGGGGGAGGAYWDETGGVFLRGGHGGGAGAPGCGGHPGEPGKTGGASIALVLLSSNSIQLVGNSLRAENGGAGGDGGIGADGGAGGNGASGESSPPFTPNSCNDAGGYCNDRCPAAGGDGGDGGDGGRGGDGGGGAGGASLAIHCVASVGIQASEDENALHFGSGGIGGNRSNNHADRAPAGEAASIKGCN